MKEIFKELIINFQTSPIPLGFKREIEYPELPYQVRKGLVLIGMRRSGKTWALYQIMQDLVSKGIEPSKILYINFEDDRLSDMQTKDFQDLLKAYFEIHPEYLQREDIHFFFDEIHEIPGWEKFIRRLLDQEKMAIYLSGSSAKMLSKEIATSLRGRTIAKEIFPFSLREYLQRQGILIPKQFGTKQKIEMVHHFNNFLRWGLFLKQ